MDGSSSGDEATRGLWFSRFAGGTAQGGWQTTNSSLFSLLIAKRKKKIADSSGLPLVRKRREAKKLVMVPPEY